MFYNGFLEVKIKSFTSIWTLFPTSTINERLEAEQKWQFDHIGRYPFIPFLIRRARAVSA